MQERTAAIRSPRDGALRRTPPPKTRSPPGSPAGSGPMTSMPGTCINSLNCWKPSSTSPRATSVPTGTPGGACTMRDAIASAMPQRSNRRDQVRAARPRRIADAAGAQHRVANGRFGADVGSRRAGRDRDRHAGAREIDAAVADRRGRRSPTARSRRRRARRSRTASPAATRRAASTPPTDTMATRLSRLALVGHRPVPPARGASPSTRCP